MGEGLVSRYFFIVMVVVFFCFGPRSKVVCLPEGVIPASLGIGSFFFSVGFSRIGGEREAENNKSVRWREVNNDTEEQKGLRQYACLLFFWCLTSVWVLLESLLARFVSVSSGFLEETLDPGPRMRAGDLLDVTLLRQTVRRAYWLRFCRAWDGIGFFRRDSEPWSQKKRRRVTLNAEKGMFFLVLLLSSLNSLSLSLLLKEGVSEGVSAWPFFYSPLFSCFCCYSYPPATFAPSNFMP